MNNTLETIIRELRATRSASSSKPNFAIVGTGMMGREHIRAILQLDQATIIGLHDSHSPSLALAEQLFVRSGRRAPKSYASLEDLANDPSVDAVFICTPNFTHRMIFDALKHSAKAIFLEKPMATTLEDAFYLAEEAISYPAPIQLGMQYRYKSQYQLALSAIAKGELGAVKMMSLCEYRPPFLKKVDEWNKFSAYSGGTLVEKCCHYFDLMNRIAGCPPVRVYASGGRAVNFIDFNYEGESSDIDDHAFVIIDYANGVRAQFTLNMFSEELYEALIVSGARGLLKAEEHASFKPGRPSRAEIRVEVIDHPAYNGFDCTFPEDIERGGHYGSTLFEHQRFVEQLEGKATDAADCNEGLWAIITATMAQESLATGAIIDVPAELRARRLDPYQKALIPKSWENHHANG